jgi:hypothetical protein
VNRHGSHHRPEGNSTPHHLSSEVTGGGAPKRGRRTMPVHHVATRQIGTFAIVVSERSRRLAAALAGCGDRARPPAIPVGSHGLVAFHRTGASHQPGGRQRVDSEAARRRWWFPFFMPALMSLLGMVFAASQRPTLDQLCWAVVLAFGISYVGWRMLVVVMEVPIFKARWRWAIGFTLLLGGPLAAGGVPHLHKVTAGQAIIVTVITAVALLGLVAFAMSPRRGSGWFMRQTSRQNGLPLCPHCGMATSAKRSACTYCGGSLPQ